MFGPFQSELLGTELPLAEHTKRQQQSTVDAKEGSAESKVVQRKSSLAYEEAGKQRSLADGEWGGVIDNDTENKRGIDHALEMVRMEVSLDMLDPENEVRNGTKCQDSNLL
eukprot:CAMPEP_0206470326 /NCGR_PEP_ID=MMETSP0324_2-20121206/30862_1 /ASSEMBLY_ACC=CAM_ASM_000836 /TAXON_ID=2866 /ORGANISM="Crypthecodinium cohnii, Strain Seligo" /LENGTH=110 /DNA_ID=CAMNT_0053944361 /DNA_START=497 /DNA_END=828 /DNA_ORIENTATION=+